ncbi:MAG: hypothetical protein QOD06_204 [Candidatus Binatota bacterium]|nr:hypothetical protein [Candidatus Binatota bacterium]
MTVDRLQELLVVEDNPGDARLVREMLKASGLRCELRVAGRLTAALELLEERPADLVLLDLSLPDSHGVETLDALQARFPDVPVVVLTGFEDETTALEALKSGAQDYLVKGRFDANLLARSVRYSIGRWSAGAETKRSLSLLTATLESSADGTLAVDRAGRIVTYNQKFLKMWNIPESVAESRQDGQIQKFVLNQLKDPVRYLQKVEELYAQEDLESYDILEFKDGRVFERYSIPERLDGKAVGRVWSFRDVTERKHVVDEMRLAKKAADAANRAKSEFVATISHELRTPLNTLIGMADLLWETSLTPEQREYVDFFRRSGDILLKLVSDILDLSKIEAGRLELERIDFDVETLIEEVTGFFRVHAREKGIEFSTEVAPDVPTKLAGDPNRLRQVLVNLISNALKFTAKGRIAVRIDRDREAPNPGGLLFTVTDTGLGIPQVKLATIFESFSQADPSISRRYGGTGLGLAISKRIVQLMGGRIWAESEVGVGSTFRFTVGFDVAAARGNGHASEVYASGRRILIIDPSEEDRDSLVAAIGQAGTIVVTEDGLEGLAEVERANAAQAPYDVVFVDARERTLGGFEVVDRLRSSLGTAGRAIFTVSPNHHGDDLSRAAALGIAGTLRKPYDPDLVRTMLTRAAGAGRDPVEGDGAAERPLRILLAEDSADSRALVGFYLRNTPHHLDLADNGESALGKFTSEKYDLVLMDMQMPVLDGYHATQAIRRWETTHDVPLTPIVALSAYGLREDIQKILSAGCTGYLNKPIKKDRLLEAIQRYTRTEPA